MSLPNAITREDFYLNKIANPSDDHELPDAITRQQHYLKAIAENAGGGGGGSAVNYSTEEREVGTWIDGSPLYQKTIHIASLPPADYATYSIASNIDKVVDYKGMVFFSTGTTVNLLYARPDDVDTEFYTAITNTKEFFLKTYKSQEGEAYVTLWYTKTTDTPGT